MFAVACIALVVSNIGLVSRLMRHRHELKQSSGPELEDIKFGHYVGLTSWSFIMLAAIISLILQFALQARA